MEKKTSKNFSSHVAMLVCHSVFLPLLNGVTSTDHRPAAFRLGIYCCNLLGSYIPLTGRVHSFPEVASTLAIET